MNGGLESIAGCHLSWEHILHKMDNNKDGKVDYKEFLSVATDHKKVLLDKNLRMAFNVIDRDGNGKITMREFRDSFCPVLRPSTIKEFFESLKIKDQDIKDAFSLFDTDGDGRITYEEFHSEISKIF